MSRLSFNFQDLRKTLTKVSRMKPPPHHVRLSRQTCFAHCGQAPGGHVRGPLDSRDLRELERAPGVCSERRLSRLACTRAPCLVFSCGRYVVVGVDRSTVHVHGSDLTSNDIDKQRMNAMNARRTGIIRYNNERKVRRATFRRRLVHVTRNESSAEQRRSRRLTVDHDPRHPRARPSADRPAPCRVVPARVRRTPARGTTPRTGGRVARVPYTGRNSDVRSDPRKL